MPTLGVFNILSIWFASYGGCTGITSNNMRLRRYCPLKNGPGTWVDAAREAQNAWKTKRRFFLLLPHAKRFFDGARHGRDSAALNTYLCWHHNIAASISPLRRQATGTAMQLRDGLTTTSERHRGMRGDAL